MVLTIFGASPSRFVFCLSTKSVIMLTECYIGKMLLTSENLMLKDRLKADLPTVHYYEIRFGPVIDPECASSP